MKFTRSHHLITLLSSIFLLTVLSQCDVFEEDRDQPILNLTAQIAPPFPCTDGLADEEFSCNGIDMFSHVPNDSLLGEQANDIWGWTDPQTNRHYALVGLTDGVSIVDITRPDSVVVTAKLNEPAFLSESSDSTIQTKSSGNTMLHDDGDEDGKGASLWRDLKVFNDHLFVVSDNQPHGLQVFDLKRLRNLPDELPAQLQGDALYDRFGSAHNIAINEQSGFAYAVGTNGENDECGSETSLHMIDIRSPQNPELAGCYSDPEIGNIVRSGYVHDTQCVVYNGPDNDYNREEICFNSSETNFSIANVEDKNTPFTIATVTYPDNAYAHQGWLSEDQRYFFLNDELDERRTGAATKTHIFDLSDLDNPEYVGAYEHETFTIDHNLFVKRDLIFESNYTSGLQVLRIDESDITNLERIAFFDTHPSGDVVEFDGSWSNYPFFDTGIIIVSDISNGLFVLSAPQ